MTEPSTAILVSAHGSPETLDDLPAFLTNIRRGRPAPPDVIDEVRRRYAAIGGTSPLARITAAQAAALGARLGLPARVAMRLWRPYPGEVLAALAAEGVRRVVSVPLAPYSVPVYHDAVAAAAAALPEPMEVVRVAPWNLEPALIAGLAASVERALARVPAGARPVLVLTAHSLPERVVAAGDPYATLVASTAAAVVAALTSPVAHRLAYQSQGMTSDAWLGPDLPATFRAARADGFDHVVVAPVGFMADHVEVLYDIDIEAVELARAAGLGLSRTETLNDTAPIVDALEAATRAALAIPAVR